MFYIRQTSNHDCGYTCLKMMLANLYHDENYLFLQDPFPRNEDVSYFAIINEAKKYNLILAGVRLPDKEDIIKMDNLPAIVTIKQYDKSHAVYLYKITKKFVYYFDPSCADYETTVLYIRLIQKQLNESANAYRDKYELSTRRIDDMRNAIKYLLALRKLYIAISDASQAEEVKKKAVVWKDKMDADHKAGLSN